MAAIRLDNTAYKNSTDFNMLNVLSDNTSNVPGYGHVMKNNLGYNAATEVSNLDQTNSDVSYNFFTLPPSSSMRMIFSRPR